jgi:hypothetical protein
MLWTNRLAGNANPTADERKRAVLRGIRRRHGVAPARKSPATEERCRGIFADDLSSGWSGPLGADS